jgi:hypothetical protein
MPQFMVCGFIRPNVCFGIYGFFLMQGKKQIAQVMYKES